MTRKNKGPCAVVNCDKNNTRFRLYSIHAANKVSEFPEKLSSYTYINGTLIINESQLCHSHYMEICESHDSIRRSRSSSRQSLVTSSRRTSIISLVSSRRNSASPNRNLTSSRRDSEIFLASVIDHELVHLSLQNNEIDLNDITIEVSDNSVDLTKENFIKLVTKIEQMNLEIYENQEQINNLLANNADINLSKHEEKVINLSFSTKIKLLTKVLYNQRHIQIELNPDNFCSMIENYEPELKGFFDKMVDAIIPISCLEKNKQAAKKSVVGFCYLLAGLRNKFINSFKLDLGLYLVSSGTSVQGIDTIANLGISVCYKTIANYNSKLSKRT